MRILFDEILEKQLVEVFKMDVEMTWACQCVIFVEDYVVLEGNKPSQLKHSWRPNHNRCGYIR